MKKVIQSLTILLHAVVFTAVLSNLTTPNNNNSVNLQKSSPQIFYPTETVVTTEL